MAGRAGHRIKNGLKELSLQDRAERLLEECRMVLPGIQALFGFQLIAVFNDGFHTRLDPLQQRAHLLALVLVAIAAALVMAPAAFHRIVLPDGISPWLVRLSSRFLVLSMLPLAVGVCIDIDLIACLIVDGPWPTVITCMLMVGFLLLWFVLPWRSRMLARSDVPPFKE